MKSKYSKFKNFDIYSPFNKKNYTNSLRITFALCINWKSFYKPKYWNDTGKINLKKKTINKIKTQAGWFFNQCKTLAGGLD